MFTENSLNLSQIIAKDLESKGLSLKVKVDSPLFEIMQYVELPVESSLESRALSKAIVNSTLSVESDGKTGYDYAMDNVVNDLSPKLKAFIKLIRSQINPQIVSLGTKVINALATLKQNDLYGISINEVKFPSILTNMEFMDLVDKRKDQEGSDSLLPLRPLFPELSQVEVRNYLMSFPGLSKDLLEIIGDSDIDYRVYNGIFRQEYSNQGNIAYLFNSHEHALDNAIISLVLGLVFANEPIEGCTGTLDEYYNGLDLLMSQAALGISTYIAKIERAAKAGILVMGRHNNTINVNPMVYKQWMDNGGDVEVIYGMALSKNIYETIPEIDSKKEEFLTLWNTAKNNDQLEKSFKYITLAKETFRKGFEEILDAEQADNLPLIGNDYDISREKFNELLEAVKIEDLDEIYTLSRKLVCRSRYPDLFIELFLEEIDKAAHGRDDLDIKDAALLATIVYVSSVVASSIEITRL